MAGDWIKMRSNLRTHPKVVRMSSALQCDALRVIGALWAVWSIADEHASVHGSDGHLDGYSLSDMSTVIAFPGFAEQMAAVGWVAECEEHTENGGKCLIFPRFDTHNGQSAKRRAEDTERKRNSRNGAASRPQSVRKVSERKADEVQTREEKRREEETPQTQRSATATVVGGGFDEVKAEQPGEPKPVNGMAMIRICQMLAAAGVVDANPGHLEFAALVQSGAVSDDAWLSAAATAVGHGKGFAYLMGIIKRQLREASGVAGAGVASVSGQSADWRATRSGIEGKGIELGLGPWDQVAFEHGTGEMFGAYEARVLAAAGVVPEKKSRATLRAREPQLLSAVVMGARAGAGASVGARV